MSSDSRRPAPVPRDMPDQQARRTDDPWDVLPGRPAAEAPPPEHAEDRRDEDARADTVSGAQDVPDTDEAGTGRAADTTPESPAPQEPTG
ncbi:hypothetical protein KUM39_23325 [Streptomyces sp. J2-1]|uniref:hypothetical protein n=1 Tax=Streptomyces corallincola TaxID=2851888 RepID=UPI001C385A2D|nr:hypothetical protein [Streptomyces corallincola]MBV2357270.1 hypothetical protein [Streptomyces corallincola]